MTATVQAEEVEKFAALAETWWDEKGPFAPLHRLNPVRLQWIRDTICQHFKRTPDDLQPFAGLSMLDIGCGGGLVTEPLARLGGQILGIDAAEKNIHVARHHAEKVGVDATYQAATAETLVGAGQTFDVVLALEVVEHVADVPQFLKECAALVRPGGILLLSTLNRTLKSYALGIIGAEYVLRWVPRGTHDWKNFLKPSEVVAHLRVSGLNIGGLSGLVYQPLRQRFALHPTDLDVNYLLWAEKAG